MKKYIINSIVVVALASIGTLVACKKSFLDQKPYTSLNVADAITTEKDMLAALNGTYSSLRSALIAFGGSSVASTTTNSFGRNIPVIGEVAADNVYVSAKNSGRYVAFGAYSWTVSATEYRDLWANLYTSILKANNIINSNLAQSKITDQYKGEAYALRALCYFELAQFFARPYTDNPAADGVPIVLKFDYTLKPKRSTVTEVYAQILSDLEKSYVLATDYRGSAYLSKYAARGLEAKVALFKGDYPTALTYAEDVIKNSGFTMLTLNNVVNYWATVKPQISTKNETLFEVVSDDVLNLGFDELANMYSQDGYGDLLCAPQFYELFGATDVRKSLINVGARKDAENPAYIVTKFKAVATDRDDKKVIRVSDVYLIAAEAAKGTNNEPLALTYLNTLTAQRDPALVYASTGATLLEDILIERRKELAFEGDRLHTLNRLKRDIFRSNVFPKGALTIPYTDFRRIGPIPQVEMIYNPNISQNPGY
nr:RagB/SusD family nutrient uptake outer membrane protein [Pedobacter sp. ASV2]